ncbi:MYND finger protein, putative [Hepatocystis sp. ex Piliocolobus tephrosceles]|nr:MYND finger protein, putative [Hepatocystis sp. ex Piliocolobus tephrosceles]
MDISDEQFFNYVNNLANLKISDIFSAKWFDYHKSIVYINAYLHSNKDMLEIIDDPRINAVVMQFEILLRELITFYFIRFLKSDENKKCNNVLSLQENTSENEFKSTKKNYDSNNFNEITNYIAFYHEMIILNIFELILFSEYVYDKIDSYIINLFAYIYTNLVSFLKTNSSEYFSKPMKELSISELLKEENDKTHNIDKLKIYVNIINTLRNLTDRIHLLNNTVVNKIVDYDILLIIVHLMEKKPWKHNNYIFENNEWVKNEDNILATTEKQLWLILYTLILNRTCQEKYEMTNYRRNNILKLRKYMNENLYEQLPPLKTLHTFIEHLYISKSVFPENKSSYLIIDMVPEIFDEIKNYIFTNKEQVLDWLKNVTIGREVLGSISDVYLSIYEFNQQICKNNSCLTKENTILNKNSKEDSKKKNTQNESYLCNNCKEEAELQCSQCKQVYYCSKDCQMKDWFNHRKVCSSAI